MKFEFGFDPSIFHEVKDLGLRKKISQIISLPLLFSLPLSLRTDMHLIFGTLLYHTKIQPTGFAVADVYKSKRFVMLELLPSVPRDLVLLVILSECLLLVKIHTKRRVKLG
jgi:hypothetical protein